jgi:hypothetical protein
MRATTRIATALVVSTLVAGCGGPIQPDELERGVDSLASAAAEGELLAQLAAEGRSRNVFTRVHARELGDTVDHEAEKLADATAPADLERARSRSVTLAQDISGALGELQVRPDDAETARTAAARLGELAKHADELASRL